MLLFVNIYTDTKTFSSILTPQEEQPQLLQPDVLQQLEQEQEGMLIVEIVGALMIIIVVFVYGGDCDRKDRRPGSSIYTVFK